MRLVLTGAWDPSAALGAVRLPLCVTNLYALFFKELDDFGRFRFCGIPPEFPWLLIYRDLQPTVNEHFRAIFLVRGFLEAGEANELSFAAHIPVPFIVYGKTLSLSWSSSFSPLAGYVLSIYLYYTLRDSMSRE